MAHPPGKSVQATLPTAAPTPRTHAQASARDPGQMDAVLARMMQACGCATQAELAALLGVGKAAISDAKRRGVAPSKWFQKLSRPPHLLNPVWLEPGLGEPGQQPVAAPPPAADAGETAPPLLRPPLVGPRPDGAGGLVLAADPAGPYAFERAWLAAKGDPDSLRLLRVTGEAMRPTLCDEDMVLLDLAQRDILEGKIYAIRIDDDVVIKRVGKKPGRLVLISDNRDYYEALDIDSSQGCAVQVLGRVVWMSRESL